MKKSFKSILLFLSILLITSCTPDQKDGQLAHRQGQLEQLQYTLRENAVDGWEANLPKSSSSGELLDPSAAPVTETVVSGDAKSVEFRKKVAKDWEELQSQKHLDFMCELWFQGWLGIGDTFAKELAETRAITEAMGIKIETIENIRMAEDNRKTINYPLPGKKYNLFVCEATTIFQLARPGRTLPSRSTIAFIYYLNNGEVKATWTANPGIKTEAIFDGAEVPSWK
jgi:hypothetical protein